MAWILLFRGLKFSKKAGTGFIFQYFIMPVPFGIFLKMVILQLGMFHANF